MRNTFIVGHIKAGRLFLMLAIRCTCGVLFYVDPRNKVNHCARCQP